VGEQHHRRRTDHCRLRTQCVRPGGPRDVLGLLRTESTITPVSVDGGPTGAYDDERRSTSKRRRRWRPGTIDIYQGRQQHRTAGHLQQIADDDTATIISTSWGTCESDPSGDPSAEQPIFEQMAAQGQTVVSAAGDSGSSDCNGITNNDPAVDDPPPSPT